MAKMNKRAGPEGQGQQSGESITITTKVTEMNRKTRTTNSSKCWMTDLKLRRGDYLH